MITDDLRDQAEASASPVQMELYATSEAGRKLRAIAEQFGITNRPDYRIFAITAGDVVMKLLRPEELEQTLQQQLPSISHDMVASLAQAIVNYAAPALNETPDNPGTPDPVLQEELQRLKEAASPEPLPAEDEVVPTLSKTPTTQNPAPQSEISELEQTASPVEPLRTMEGDMATAQTQGEQTYTSSQDAILQQPEATPPQTGYSQTPEPRPDQTPQT